MTEEEFAVLQYEDGRRALSSLLRDCLRRFAAAGSLVNYRTSHQIRMQADRLLGPDVSDVDGNKEDRNGTVSLFNGPKPNIAVLDSPESEIKAVGQWLAARVKEVVAPHEMGVFVRSEAEMSRARAAVESAALPVKVLDD